MTPPRPTWINLDQIVRMVAAPDRGARLYTGTVVRTNTYKNAVSDIPEFFYIDVVESLDEIMRAVRKRGDQGADERLEEKALA